MKKSVRDRANKQEAMKAEKQANKVAQAAKMFSTGTKESGSDKGLRCPGCQHLNSLTLTAKGGYFEDFKCTKCGIKARLSLINGEIKEFK